MTDLYAFMHVYADGQWMEPCMDYLDALNDSGLDDALTGRYLGLVGTPQNRLAVTKVFHDFGRKWTVAAQADEGFTQITLSALREFAQDHDGAVIYAHSKGALNHTEFNRRWLKTMLHYTIDYWVDVIPHLADHDAAGCFWITPEEFPNMQDADGRNFFGGEVYWARLDWIRKLPPLKTDNRWQSESWISENPDFRHYELGKHGWPNESLFI